MIQTSLAAEECGGQASSRSSPTLAAARTAACPSLQEQKQPSWGRQLLHGASFPGLPSRGKGSPVEVEKVLTEWEMLSSRLSPPWSQFEF